ncbi:MAG: flagellar hook protein FlgE [Bacillota bacterium]|nr:flagellar hook protein FlgE [Bacillota bacterium]MDI7248803.1 flagellar hook protein FlgE [Bacillota bacterium]
MLRSLFAGVSGLRNHQIRMDVIGNNIANVNTVGFKAGRATFREMFSQLLSAASAPQGGRGGTNPLQVGLGVALASIDTLHEQGNLESTGVATDLAVDGAGFFIVSDGIRTSYTRAGAFSWDDRYNLVTPSGLKVMGWLAQNGVLPADRTGVNLKPISLSHMQSIPARATSEIGFSRNLDATDMGTYTLSSNSLNLTLSDGTTVRKVTFELSPTSEFNKWRWHLAGDGVQFCLKLNPDEADWATVADGYIEFDPAGNVARVTDLAGLDLINLDPDDPGSGPEVQVRDATDASLVDYINFPIPGTDSKTSWTISGTNVPAGSPPGTTAQSIEATYGEARRVTSISVVGAKGETYSVITTFTKVNDNTWDWVAEVKDSAGAPLNLTGKPHSGTVVFDVTGRVDRVTGDLLEFVATGYAPLSLQMDFYGLTQYASDYTALASDQNGYGPGELVSVSVDAKGVVMGSYSNAMSCPLAQVALASFSNPAGLVKRGETLYERSANSGEPQVGDPGSGGRGTIAPGSLEMSNVDLAQEFTNLIVTQRGFQANSRVITTADEMLQDLVNLKR